MRLDGRRESTNVDDRRGSRGVKVGGGLGVYLDLSFFSSMKKQIGADGDTFSPDYNRL